MGDILDEEIKKDIDGKLEALSEDLQRCYKDETYSMEQMVTDILSIFYLCANNVMMSFNDVDKNQRKEFDIYLFAQKYAGSNPKNYENLILEITQQSYKKSGDKSYGMKTLQRICKDAISQIYVQKDNTDKKIDTVMKRVKKYLEDALKCKLGDKKYMDSIHEAYKGLRMSAELDEKIMSDRKNKAKGLCAWYIDDENDKFENGNDSYNSNEERAVMAMADKKYQPSFLRFGTSRLKIIKSVVERLKEKISKERKTNQEN